jgi:hypothetical protein
MRGIYGVDAGMILEPGSRQDETEEQDAGAPAIGLFCAVALSSVFWVMLALVLYAI